jgi:hypothetical protein
MALHAQLEELLDRIMPMVKHFHGTSMFAPHAATMDGAGTVAGHALSSDGTSNLSVPQAIAHFESSFKQLAQDGAIVASAIFYHGGAIDTSSGKLALPPASTTDECLAVVGLLEHVSGESVYILIAYQGEPGNVEYSPGKLIEKPPAVFLSRQVQPPKPWWKLW